MLFYRLEESSSDIRSLDSISKHSINKVAEVTVTVRYSRTYLFVGVYYFVFFAGVLLKTFKK